MCICACLYLVTHLHAHIQTQGIVMCPGLHVSMEVGIEMCTFVYINIVLNTHKQRKRENLHHFNQLNF